MNGYHEPFADELLTSWFARRRLGRRDHHAPEPKPVLNRHGEWLHPDIRPTRAWTGAVSKYFCLPQAQLAEATIARSHPALPLDFLSWDWSPFRDDYEHYRPPPALHIAWCNRCLAEDFAAGRPAYIRHHWVFASVSFCHYHRWPLEDQCGACLSMNWRYSTPTRGPLRMICPECWRSRERAAPHALSADDDMRHCWDRIIDFETQLLIALHGKTPDQFRFNFTSACQLVNEVRDICHLLTHFKWPCSPFDPWYSPYDIALNDFVCAALWPGSLPRKFRFSPHSFPLTSARMAMRRSLLAAAAAIIDSRSETGNELFGAMPRSAIETFVAMVSANALDSILARPGHWAPTMVRQIKAAQPRRWPPTATNAPRQRWQMPNVTISRR